MLYKIRKFTKLSSKEKKLFLEAYVTLGIMRAAILTVSFKRLTRSLEYLPNKEELTPLNDNEISIATTADQAIIRAVVYTPWESAVSYCAKDATKAWYSWSFLPWSNEG